MTPAGLAALFAELTIDEGVRHNAYQDGGGVSTIGVGHTGPEVHRGLVWTHAEIHAAFVADVQRAGEGIAKALPWFAKLNDARQGVLEDMAFNLGVAGLLAFHRSLTYVEDGEYSQAAACMLTSQPWARQVGARAERLAAWMPTGVCAVA